MKTLNTCWQVFWVTLCLLIFIQSAKADYCSPSCHGQINLSLPQSGNAVITSNMMLSGSSNCSGNWQVTTTDANGNVLPGNVVNCAYLGQLLTVSVEDVTTGNDCWGYVLIEDKLPPTITCIDVTIGCSDSTDPSNTGMPTVVENCFGTPTLTYTDIPIHHNCTHPLYDVTIERTWTATDASGNTMSCTQNIFLEKALLADVVFPAMAIVDCSNPNLDPTNTGEPSISGGGGFGGFCNLKYGYDDGPEIPTCPGGYKFVREWFVVDCCSNNGVVTGNQIIEVRDTTPPVITCPANQTISASSNSCTGSLTLPTATATDNCSTPTITVSSSSGVIFGNSISGLEEGTHTLQYIATDGCGNMDTCEMTITVIDLLAPVAICDFNTVVSLDNTGCGILRDSTVDDGSTDNCCIDTFFIRRVGDVDFEHFVKFDCSDIGDTIMVEFKVQDKSGNMNFCMTRVTVQDKIDPTLICPPDKTIECTEFPLDTDLVGVALALDSCGIDSLVFADDISGFDPCTKTGTIIRTWTAVDVNGNTVSCDQTITLQDTSDPPVFNAPPTIDISCTESTDPSNTGFPTVTNSGCTSYSFGEPSDLVVVGLDVCDKHIIRTWTFVNDCTNQVVFQGNQLINIIDDEAPKITCTADITVNDTPFPISGQSSSCQEFVQTVIATATDSCSGMLSVTNDYTNGADFASSSFASEVYPIGTTTVTFTATDLCNNTSTCQIDVTVEDITSPTITCRELFFFPTLSIDANLTEASIQDSIVAIDACSNPITFSFGYNVSMPTSFSCSDFGIGESLVTYPVTYVFTDAAGNVDSCSAEINISNLGCTTPLLFAGAIFSEMNEMVKNVDLEISDGIDLMIYTDDNGFYHYSPPTTGGNYTITPYKNNDFTNGVTTYDLIKIRRHILGLEILDTPYKMIAADANRDELITTFDIVSFKQLILQNWDELPDNTSWRFIDYNYQFPNMTDPFEEEFPEHLDCVNMTQSQMYLNFRGVKIGDINNSASTNDLIASDTRGTDNISFETDDLFLEKDEIYHIPIYAKDAEQLDGFQFTLNVDSDMVEFLNIEKGLLDESDFGYRFEDDGLITASWVKPVDVNLENENVLFFVNIKCKQNSHLHQILSIDSQKTPAFAYRSTGEIQGINLFFENKKEEIVEEKRIFELYQNQPNPFSETTSIRFYLPENSDVELQILDVAGKTIQTFSDYYLLGEHTIELKSNVFPSTGIYVYKLITPSFSGSKKMTIIK